MVCKYKVNMTFLSVKPQTFNMLMQSGMMGVLHSEVASLVVGKGITFKGGADRGKATSYRISDRDIIQSRVGSGSVRIDCKHIKMELKQVPPGAHIIEK